MEGALPPGSFRGGPGGGGLLPGTGPHPSRHPPWTKPGGAAEEERLAILGPAQPAAPPSTGAPPPLPMQACVKRHSREALPLMDGGTLQFTEPLLQFIRNTTVYRAWRGFHRRFSTVLRLKRALQRAGQLRRGSGIYEHLVVDGELHRVPGTLQFVKHVPSS